MVNYEGQVCDICGKPFDKDSNIVVCPECGTPRHRQCYNQLGHCVHQDKHSEGFEWKPVIKEPDPTMVKCPQCGANMPRTASFCENCGAKLLPQSEQPQVPPFQHGPQVSGGGIPGLGGFVVINSGNMEPMSGSRLNQEIDGVSISDLIRYIGPSSQYYIFKFLRMERDPMYKPFCWSAPLFGPLYFIFRKMWKIALPYMLITFILNIPAAFTMAVQMGLITATLPSWIASASNICYGLNIAISVISGFLAIPIYKKETINSIKAMKEKYGDKSQLYYQRLTAKSGPSKVGMFLAFAYAAYMFYSLFLI